MDEWHVGLAIIPVFAGLFGLLYRHSNNKSVHVTNGMSAETINAHFETVKVEIQAIAKELKTFREEDRDGHTEIKRQIEGLRE